MQGTTWNRHLENCRCDSTAQAAERSGAFRALYSGKSFFQASWTCCDHYSLQMTLAKLSSATNLCFHFPVKFSLTGKVSVEGCICSLLRAPRPDAYAHKNQAITGQTLITINRLSPVVQLTWRNYPMWNDGFDSKEANSAYTRNNVQTSTSTGQCIPPSQLTRPSWTWSRSFHDADLSPG